MSFTVWFRGDSVANIIFITEVFLCFDKFYENTTDAFDFNINRMPQP